MSDILNIQPNAGQTPNEDTTFEIEGYANHIQNLEKAYPDEEPVIQPEAGDEFAPLPEAESTPTPPTESAESTDAPQPEAEEFKGNKLFERGIAKQNQFWEADEITGDLKLDSIRDGEGRKLIDLPNGREMVYRNSLHKVKHDKEDQLMELLKGTNLENKLLAHKMIVEDPELVARLDRNKDGQMTYSDFFDVTHLNNGKGLSAEEDERITK